MTVGEDWMSQGTPVIVMLVTVTPGIQWVRPERLLLGPQCPGRPESGEWEFISPSRTPPWDFPGGAVAKNLPADAGDTDSVPGPGRVHMLRSN